MCCTTPADWTNSIMTDIGKDDIDAEKIDWRAA